VGEGQKTSRQFFRCLRSLEWPLSGSTYLLDAYWPSRKEDEVSCATRLRSLLQRLPAGPTPATWKEGYRTLNLDALASLFDRNRFYTDGRNKRWMPQLGFRAMLSSRMFLSDQCFIDLHVGAYGDPNPHRNSIQFEIRNVPSGWGVKDASSLRPIIRAVVETWGAEEASLSHSSYREYRRSYKRDNGSDVYYLPWEGWITYLPPEKAACVKAPEDVAVEALPNGGSIYTLCEELFSLDNPLHMQRATAMQRALEPIQCP
jgi:hypothetical protein